MKVGIPKESAIDELRVGATPKTVKRLIKQGFDVFVESQAGAQANYTDDNYKDAGAHIKSSATELFDAVDIILKVQPFNDSEIELIERRASITKLPLPCC